MLCYAFYIQLFLILFTLGCIIDHRSGKFILLLLAYLGALLIVITLQSPLWITLSNIVLILISVLIILRMLQRYHWYDVGVLILIFNTLLCCVQGVKWILT